MDLLSETFYYVAPSNKTRDRPMRVLCLGLMRTGTDSLHTALEDLGYRASHGYTFSGFIAQQAAIARFIERRDRGELAKLSQQELKQACDAFLGDYMAVTDIHTAVIGHELLRAYPDAKVVLNTRDVDAWVPSVQNVMKTYLASRMWFWRWFEPVCWWNHAASHRIFDRFFRGNFDAFGKQVFFEHYGGLKARLEKESRQYLEWRVEDGWRPLCEFLGDEVPDRPFPSGNTPAEFARKFQGRHGDIFARARRNLVLATSVVGLAVAGGAGLLMNGGRMPAIIPGGLRSG